MTIFKSYFAPRHHSEQPFFGSEYGVWFPPTESPMLSRSLSLLFLCADLLPLPSASADVYELRTYTTHDGKLDNLHARFRDHTVALFTKHGMESVGYWVPTDSPRSQNTLIYVLRHDSRDAAKASWKAFLSDPDWQQVYKESEVDGPILAKAPESIYMEATDYSPKFQGNDPSDEAVYELRIYRTAEGKLEPLDARFRDHTIGIFDRYQMQSVGYWHPTDSPGSQDTLIYILRHQSRDAAKDSWKSFGADEQWKQVAQESQKNGRFLRERPEVVYMSPTDYSAIR